MRRNTALPIAP